MKYTITSIGNDICRHVRERRTDPIYGYEYNVMRSIAGIGGYGPCRSCLKKFEPGETRLLFLHNPFGNEYGDFAGPVFIHEKECGSFAGGEELPQELHDVPKFLRCYDINGHFLSHHEINAGPISNKTSTLFNVRRCREIHVRNSEARCFIAKAIRI